MVELMVVITIIVLMLAVAVPVVRVVQGNRNVDSGYNAVAAALGHARQLALYYRQPVGVMFYRDPLNGGQDIRYVMRANFLGQLFPNYATMFTSNNVLSDQYLDIIPGEPMVTLPTGVAVQVIMGNGAALTSGPPAPTERYMRLGIVLFDEDGQLSSTPYAISCPGNGTSTGGLSSLIAQTGLPQTVLPPGPTFVTSNFTGTAANPLYTHPAICLYDEESYLNQVDQTNGDPFSDDNNNTVTFGAAFTPQWPSNMPTGNQTIGNLKSDKLAEQNWLDQNGEVFVIRPNDGSLLRNK
jgi:hypothetical protein